MTARPDHRLVRSRDRAMVRRPDPQHPSRKGNDDAHRRTAYQRREAPTTDGPVRFDDDRALADAVLGGDHDAFRVLVDREAAAVLAVCRRVLGDPTDAEDAAQEAFLLAYRKLGAYRGDGPLGGWLMRIAIREARDRAIRRRSTESLPMNDDGPLGGLGLAVAHTATDGPEAALEGGERAARLHAAVADLPAHYRDAVRGRYMDELSFEEIAMATGRPQPTVRTHLHRGLARLRASLGDEARP